MEYREHPRSAAADVRLDGMVGDPDSRPRNRRFDFRRSERPLDTPRVLLAGLIVLGALSMLGYVGLHTARSAVRWLHRQPQYQLPFGEIQLRPEPPPWFRGGTEAFLTQVRQRAGEPEVVSVLDVDPGRLRRAFQDYSPWVEEVVRITYPPHQIIVDLVYKRPVAIHEAAPGSEVYLDGNGHILPGEDIDLERLGPLIRITGQQLVPSPENRPGGIWKSGLPGVESDRLERCIRGAAALAGFLQESPRREDRAGSPALDVVSIYATDPRGLFLQTAEGVQILWGDVPGKEPAGALDAAQKWEILQKWAVSSPQRKLAHRGYWTFGRSDLRPVEPVAGRS